MSNIIFVAETGADIPAGLAEEKNIQLVPMHVSMGAQILDDGTFPAKEICLYFDKTESLPKTSGCSPNDFAKVFDAVHARWPDKKFCIWPIRQ